MNDEGACVYLPLDDLAESLLLEQVNRADVLEPLVDNLASASREFSGLLVFGDLTRVTEVRLDAGVSAMDWGRFRAGMVGAIQELLMAMLRDRGIETDISSDFGLGDEPGLSQGVPKEMITRSLPGFVGFPVAGVGHGLFSPLSVAAETACTLGWPMWLSGPWFLPQGEVSVSSYARVAEPSFPLAVLPLLAETGVRAFSRDLQAAEGAIGASSLQRTTFIA